MSVVKPSHERRPRRRAKDRRKALKRAILRLPVGPRDVFLLHRFGGLSFDQISEHLGLERAEVNALMVEALVRITRAMHPSEA